MKNQTDKGDSAEPIVEEILDAVIKAFELLTHAYGEAIFMRLEEEAGALASAQQKLAEVHADILMLNAQEQRQGTQSADSDGCKEGAI